MLTGTELKTLADDIAEHGLREPVWLWCDPDDGTEYLLDGRNRTAACAESGTEVKTRYYTGDDPISFAVSLNVTRRHLTPGQKSMLALRLVPMYEEQGRKEIARAVAKANAAKPKRSSTGAELHQLKEPEVKPRAPKSTDKAAAVTGPVRAWNLLISVRRTHFCMVDWSN